MVRRLPTGRAGLLKKRGAAIASMLGADRPVYATPLENLRAAQAAVDELNGLGADELPYMTRRIQQLIDAAAEWHEAGSARPARRRHTEGGTVDFALVSLSEASHGSYLLAFRDEGEAACLQSLGVGVGRDGDG